MRKGMESRPITQKRPDGGTELLNRDCPDTENELGYSYAHARGAPARDSLKHCTGWRQQQNKA